MAVTSEQTTNSSDSVKIFLALAALVAGVVGYYYFSNQPSLYRVLGMVAAAIVSIAIFLTSSKGQSLRGFLKKARIEVRKVVWPTRQEAVQTTIAVLIGVFIMAVFLWLLDSFLGWAVKSLITGG